MHNQENILFFLSIFFLYISLFFGNLYNEFKAFIILNPYHTFHKWKSYFSGFHMLPFGMNKDWGTQHCCFHTLVYYQHCHHSHSNTEDIHTRKHVHCLMECIYHRSGRFCFGKGQPYPQDKHSILGSQHIMPTTVPLDLLSWSSFL